MDLPIAENFKQVIASTSGFYFESAAPGEWFIASADGDPQYQLRCWPTSVMEEAWIAWACTYAVKRRWRMLFWGHSKKSGGFDWLQVGYAKTLEEAKATLTALARFEYPRSST